MLRYRNKAEFAVAMTSAGPLVISTSAVQQIVDCTDCLLQKRATMAQQPRNPQSPTGQADFVYDEWQDF